MEDLYTRAWCLVEYIYVTWQAEKAPMSGSKHASAGPFARTEAKKFGFYKDKVLITGPNQFSEPGMESDLAGRL